MVGSRIGWRWLAMILVISSAAVHLPGLVIGPSLDAAVFDVVGWRFVEGAPLYGGIWDHKPPGIYLLSVAAEAARGLVYPWLVTWTISVLATAATGLLLAGLLARTGLRHVALPVAILLVLLSGEYLISLGGGLAEQPATAAATAGVLLAVAPGNTPRWIGAGALLAVGVIISVQVAPAVLALTVLALRGEAPVRGLAAVAAGGLAVLLVTLAILAFTGVLEPAADAILVYNAAYRLAAEGAPPTFRALPWTVLATMPLLALAAAGMLAVRRWPEAMTLALAAAAWTVGGLILLGVQGRFYAHYVVPVMVPMALLAGIGWADLDRLRRRRPGITPMLATVAVALVLVAASAGIAGGLQELRTWGAANDRVRSIAGVIRGTTTPDETIVVWGNQPYLYRVSERAPALRYPYLFPLTTPGYTTPALIEGMRADLEREPPAVVVDAGSPGVGQPGDVPLLIDRPIATEGRELDLLDPLREFVRDNYELYGVLQGWPVYRLVPPS
jgi:hypothetical protein